MRVLDKLSTPRVVTWVLRSQKTLNPIGSQVPRLGATVGSYGGVFLMSEVPLFARESVLHRRDILQRVSVRYPLSTRTRSIIHDSKTCLERHVAPSLQSPMVYRGTSLIRNVHPPRITHGP